MYQLSIVNAHLQPTPRHTRASVLNVPIGDRPERHLPGGMGQVGSSASPVTLQIVEEIDSPYKLRRL